MRLKTIVFSTFKATILVTIGIAKTLLRIFDLMFGRFFIRRYAKHIYKLGHNKDLPKYAPGACKNLAGLGGQEFSTRFVSWQALFDQSKSAELRRWANHPRVVRETLFFEYFGPLEHWCDTNCHSGYYLFSDVNGIHLRFTDAMDETIFRLRFDGHMPRLDDF